MLQNKIEGTWKIIFLPKKVGFKTFKKCFQNAKSNVFETFRIVVPKEIQVISKIQTKVPARFSLWGLNLFRTIFLLFLASTVECTDTVKNVLGLWCPLFCRGVNWKSVFTVNPKKFLVFDKAAATEMMYRTSHLFVKRAWPVCHPLVCPSCILMDIYIVDGRERAGQINPMKFFSMNRKRCFRYLKSRWYVPIIELYYFQVILEFFFNKSEKLFLERENFQ